MASDKYPVKRLEGSGDYDPWSYEMQAYLEREGLWEYVTVESEKIVPYLAEKATKARSAIILCVSRSCFVNIKEKTSAKEMWEALRAAYWDSGLCQKVALLKQFANLRAENCSSMEEFVNKMCGIVVNLREKGFKMEDEWVAHFILAGLPDTYKPMIMALQNSAATLNLSTIKQHLVQDELSEKQNNTTTALVANRSYNGKGRFPNNSNKQPQKNHKQVTCYNCGELGHYADKCRSGRNQSQNNSRAFNSNRNKSRRNSNTDSAMCAMMVKVNDKDDNEDQEDDQVDDQTESAMVAAFNMNGEDSEEEQGEEDDQWIIDSGASAHMVKSKRAGILPHDQPGINTADGRRVPVAGKGDIKVNLIVNNHVEKITLMNVLHVPGLSYNLLSVIAVMRSGKRIVFENMRCEIFSGNKLIATGTLCEASGMILLDTVNKYNDTAAVAVGAVSPMIWHRRFGHLCADYLAKITQIGDQGRHGDCLTCAKGKMERLPFPSSESRSSQCLDLVHSDIAGPMETESIGGKKYYITFIDDFSRKVFVYMLRNKSEAFEKFKIFQAQAERTHGRKIKSLRTDNGGEYCSKEFAAFLQQQGIEHQTTVPYNSEQNGVSERLNKTILCKVRCMLVESGLPKNVWAEAVNTAVYIINRSPASAVQFKIPEEIWCGKEVSVRHLRVFGSKCVIHIPKQSRKKLDQSGQEGVFVGYSQTQKAYRILLKDNTVKIERNVKVFENYENENGKVNTNEMPVLLDLSESSEACNRGGTEDDESESESSFSTATGSDSSAESNNDSSPDTDNDAAKEVPIVKIDEIIEPTVNRAPGLGEDGPRRSPRTPKPLKHQDFVYLSYDRAIPNNYKDAVSGIDREKWIEAMEKELESIRSNETWNLLDRPSNSKVIKNRWVFRIKETDQFPVFKARLVVKGFMQHDDGLETFSPVVRYETIRSVLALASQEKMVIQKFDVKTAFLNGELKEDVYMEQPDGYNDGTGRVCKLKRSLYGLKQAPRCWGERIRNYLENQGLISSEADPCMFVKRMKNDVLILLLYVDDGLVIASNNEIAGKFMEKLEKEFEITKCSNVTSFLGFEMKRTNNVIGICQSKYISKLLTEFRMENANTLNYPIRQGWDNEGSKLFENNRLYREIVGSLIYLAGVSRPDISFAVNVISRALEKPTVAHFSLAKDILRYLKGTKDKMLTFSGDIGNITVYTDADYGGDRVGRKSTSGVVGFLGDAPVIWRSHLQRIVALSTTEAELIAGCEGACEAIWLKKLVNEMGIPTVTAKVYIDNKSTLSLIKNPSFHQRSKHIDIKMKHMRDLYNKNQITFDYVRTTDQRADGMTKALVGAAFDCFVNIFGY